MRVYVFVDKIAGRYEVRRAYLAGGRFPYSFTFTLIGLTFGNLDDVRERVRAFLKSHGFNPDIPIVIKPWPKRGYV